MKRGKARAMMQWSIGNKCVYKFVINRSTVYLKC